MKTIIILCNPHFVEAKALKAFQPRFADSLALAMIFQKLFLLLFITSIVFAISFLIAEFAFCQDKFNRFTSYNHNHVVL